MERSGLAILGTPGFIRDPERFTDDALLQALGANAGNLMFQYGVTQLLAGPLVHYSASDTPYSERTPLDRAAALVFPAANHLRTGADWTGLSNFLEEARKPLIILGLGVQADAGEHPTTAATRLAADPHVRRLVALLRDSAPVIGLRGAYTAQVCAALGVTQTHVLGCPSLFLNADPDLGDAIAQHLTEARRHPSRASFTLAAAAPFEIMDQPERRTLERLLFGWMSASGGCYVQQSGGVTAMRAARGATVADNLWQSLAHILTPDHPVAEFRRIIETVGQFHTSAPGWIAAMRDCGIVIGTRLHGVMAAIAAGRPGIVIPHDSRTAELASLMQLPRIAFHDALRARTPAQALDMVRFDAGTFNVTRQTLAARMVSALEPQGIALRDPIRQLATRHRRAA